MNKIYFYNLMPKYKILFFFTHTMRMRANVCKLPVKILPAGVLDNLINVTYVRIYMCM